MKPRVTINTGPHDSLKIEILVRQWGLFAFSVIYVGLLAAFISVVLYALLTGSGSDQKAVSVLAVLVIFLFAAPLVALASYLLWGKEHIVLTPDTLTVTSDFFSYGRSREFKIAQISGLQVNKRWAAFPRWGFNRMLALTYKGQRHRFGIELSKDEAQEILEQIRGYLSSHR